MTTVTLRGRRAWACLAGCAALLGLLLWQGPQSQLSAQDDPAPPKKTTKVLPKKGVKTVKKVAPPEVNDVVVAGETGGLEQIKLINDTIVKGWEDNNITPSERCSDYEFIRRASLDIIGRIAKVNEIDRFMKDPLERRRSMLIERLMGLEKGPDQQMYAESFADNWAGIWTNMLLTRQGTAKVYQEQMRDWLRSSFMEQRASATSEEFSRVPDWSKIVTELVSATGITNENGAVTYVLAHLGEAVMAEKESYGAFDVIPLTSRTTRLFLGLRTQCVQCHDHPFNDEWSQFHFWGINAFFRQVDAPQGRLEMMMMKGKGMTAPQRELVDNPTLNVKGIIPYERRTGVFLYTDPTFLDGKKMKMAADSSRRKELAKFITTSPFFAKVFVNRMFDHFLGQPLTKDAIDDFGEHNPVTFPELLDELGDKWAKEYNHNPKVLVRWVCNSRPYGLSSNSNETNDKREDEVFFPRMQLKAMSPEQLFESLMTATDAKVGQGKESRMALREEWLDKLIVNFGDDEGNEGSFNGTVVQALMLMNGEDINKAITDKDTGAVANVLKKRAFSRTAAFDAMKDLYLAALNRPPSKAEYARVLDPKMFNLPRSGPPRDVAAFWTNFYQDIFWAVLNSNEFILNH